MSLAKFFTTMLRIGATGFGGPMALISMLQQHLVERHKAISDEEFAEGVALGQVLPGPIAIDAAIHAGYRLFGWWGAVAAPVGMILPPFLIMLVLTPLYFHYGTVPSAVGFFAGVRPAVVAAIIAASFRLGKKGIKDTSGYFIAGLVFVWMVARQFIKPLLADLPENSIGSIAFNQTGATFLIAASAVLGILFYRKPPKVAAEPAEAPGDDANDKEGDN